MTEQSNTTGQPAPEPAATMNSTTVHATNTVDQDQNKTLTLVVYILQLVSCFVGFTSIVGIIINYIKRAEVRGTYLESHFTWQIRTFWWMLVWSLIGLVTTFFGIGFIVLLVAAVWFIYRAVRGLLNLNDNKPMPV
ncbi:hypothetical protein NOG12_01350 [Pseudidiomarina sp. GXY010]|uniref:Transmembrane protein n=1 Tax=Pseudidiomarina fusca TaxID=2965078 RepID=A0ABU3KTB6_9GAMM|nr:hypothetical protein [Pseudidiomarina sp. GXY010]MDT7524744.1 hypothetical protein [Pseudidiomarina sp. GXY010]